MKIIRKIISVITSMSLSVSSVCAGGVPFRNPASFVLAAPGISGNRLGEDLSRSLLDVVLTMRSDVLSPAKHDTLNTIIRELITDASNKSDHSKQYKSMNNESRKALQELIPKLAIEDELKKDLLKLLGMKSFRIFYLEPKYLEADFMAVAENKEVFRQASHWGHAGTARKSDGSQKPFDAKGVQNNVYLSTRWTDFISPAERTMLILKNMIYLVRGIDEKTRGLQEPACMGLIKLYDKRFELDKIRTSIAMYYRYKELMYGAIQTDKQKEAHALYRKWLETVSELSERIPAVSNETIASLLPIQHCFSFNPQAIYNAVAELRAVTRTSFPAHVEKLVDEVIDEVVTALYDRKTDREFWREKLKSGINPPSAHLLVPEKYFNTTLFKTKRNELLGLIVKLSGLGKTYGFLDDTLEQLFVNQPEPSWMEVRTTLMHELVHYLAKKKQILIDVMWEHTTFAVDLVTKILHSCGGDIEEAEKNIILHSFEYGHMVKPLYEHGKNCARDPAFAAFLINPEVSDKQAGYCSIDLLVIEAIKIYNQHGMDAAPLKRYLKYAQNPPTDPIRFAQFHQDRYAAQMSAGFLFAGMLMDTYKKDGIHPLRSMRDFFYRLDQVFGPPSEEDMLWVNRELMPFLENLAVNLYGKRTRFLPGRALAQLGLWQFTAGEFDAEVAYWPFTLYPRGRNDPNRTPHRKRAEERAVANLNLAIFRYFYGQDKKFEKDKQKHFDNPAFKTLWDIMLIPRSIAKGAPVVSKKKTSERDRQLVARIPELITYVFRAKFSLGNPEAEQMIFQSLPLNLRFLDSLLYRWSFYDPGVSLIKKEDIDVAMLKERLNEENEINSFFMEQTGVDKDSIGNMTEDMACDAFNTIIQMKDFYTRVDAGKLIKVPETKKILEKAMSNRQVLNRELILLNRSLLQALYPRVLVRHLCSLEDPRVDAGSRIDDAVLASMQDGWLDVLFRVDACNSYEDIYTRIIENIWPVYKELYEEAIEIEKNKQLITELQKKDELPEGVWDPENLTRAERDFLNQFFQQLAHAIQQAIQQQAEDMVNQATMGSLPGQAGMPGESQQGQGSQPGSGMQMPQAGSAGLPSGQQNFSQSISQLSQMAGSLSQQVQNIALQAGDISQGASGIGSEAGSEPSRGNTLNQMAQALQQAVASLGRDIQDFRNGSAATHQQAVSIENQDGTAPGGLEPVTDSTAQTVSQASQMNEQYQNLQNLTNQLTGLTQSLNELLGREGTDTTAQHTATNAIVNQSNDISQVSDNIAGTGESIVSTLNDLQETVSHLEEHQAAIQAAVPEEKPGDTDRDSRTGTGDKTGTGEEEQETTPSSQEGGSHGEEASETRPEMQLGSNQSQTALSQIIDDLQTKSDEPDEHEEEEEFEPEFKIDWEAVSEQERIDEMERTGLNEKELAIYKEYLELIGEDTIEEMVYVLRALLGLDIGIKHKRQKKKGRLKRPVQAMLGGLGFQTRHKKYPHPIQLTFLVDRSSSMDQGSKKQLSKRLIEKRLIWAKLTAMLFLEAIFAVNDELELKGFDPIQFEVADFNNTSKTFLSHETSAEIGEDRKERLIFDALLKLEASGGTRDNEAIAKYASRLIEAPSKKHNVKAHKFLFLLSDGDVVDKKVGQTVAGAQEEGINIIMIPAGDEKCRKIMIESAGTKNVVKFKTLADMPRETARHFLRTLGPRVKNINWQQILAYLSGMGPILLGMRQILGPFISVGERLISKKAGTMPGLWSTDLPGASPLRVNDPRTSRLIDTRM